MVKGTSAEVPAITSSSPGHSGFNMVSVWPTGPSSLVPVGRGGIVGLSERSGYLDYQKKKNLSSRDFAASLMILFCYYFTGFTTTTKKTIRNIFFFELYMDILTPHKWSRLVTCCYVSVPYPWRCRNVNFPSDRDSNPGSFTVLSFFPQFNRHKATVGPG